MKIFMALITVCSLVALVLPADAADYEISLCVESSWTMDMFINHQGDDVYSVNGVIRAQKPVPISGTAILEGNEVRFGITLHNQLEGWIPVVWEFMAPLDNFTGSIFWQWLTDGEDVGTLAFGPAPCVSALRRSVIPEARGLGK